MWHGVDVADFAVRFLKDQTGGGVLAKQCAVFGGCVAGTISRHIGIEKISKDGVYHYATIEADAALNFSGLQDVSSVALQIEQ